MDIVFHTQNTICGGTPISVCYYHSVIGNRLVKNIQLYLWLGSWHTFNKVNEEIEIIYVILIVSILIDWYIYYNICYSIIFKHYKWYIIDWGSLRFTKRIKRAMTTRTRTLVLFECFYTMMYFFVNRRWRSRDCV